MPDEEFVHLHVVKPEKGHRRAMKFDCVHRPGAKVGSRYILGDQIYVKIAGRHKQPCQFDQIPSVVVEPWPGRRTRWTIRQLRSELRQFCDEADRMEPSRRLAESTRAAYREGIERFLGFLVYEEGQTARKKPPYS